MNKHESITAKREGIFATIVKTTEQGSKHTLQIVIPEYEVGNCPQYLTPLDIALLESLGIKRG
jgi:hypothetical protein